MNQSTPSFGFYKFRITDVDPAEYKKKSWGKLPIETKNAKFFQGKLDTCSKSFYISGNFKNTNGVLTVTEKTEIIYEKINPNTITKDEMNYFMLELSPGPMDRMRYDPIYEMLPMSVEKFKLLPEFKDFKSCDYFRMEYEYPLRILFQNQKRIKELTGEQLIEINDMVNVYPWKACFDKYMAPYKLKEATYKGFFLFKIKYKKKLQPLYLQAIRLYSYMKDERERGNDLFDRETLFESYFNDPKWREIAYEQNDKNMQPALDFLMFQGLSNLDYTGKSDRFIGLTRDLMTNRYLIYDMVNMFERGLAAPRNGTHTACIPSPLLSEDQRNVINHALNNKITLLEGAPGTGKTEVLVGIMSELCKRFIKDKPCGPLVVTYIGMMVDALQKRFGGRSETANTIHYICCKIENTEDPKVLEWIGTFDILIVDEGSNIDVRLFGRLLKCLPNLKQLVIVGDLGQIFPIKPGCPFYDLVHTFKNHSFMLTENKRVDPSSRHLAEAASLIRNGESIKVGFDTDCLKMIEDRSDAKLIEIVDDFVNSLEDTMKMQVIVLRNEDRKRLNRLIEDILISRGILKRGKSYNSNGCFLYPGKKIMFTKKYVHEKYDMVRNGEMGQVKRINKDILELTNGKKMPVADVEVCPGYATTCNKAQGSEWDNILFWMYESPNPFFTREYPYVAISRAKKKCIVIGKPEEFHKMCKHKAQERRTIFRYYLSLEELSKKVPKDLGSTDIRDPEDPEDPEDIDNLFEELPQKRSSNVPKGVLQLLPMGEYAVCLPPDPSADDETTKKDNKRHFSKFAYTKDRNN